jgi:hypothetical protein
MNLKTYAFEATKPNYGEGAHLFLLWGQHTIPSLKLGGNQLRAGKRRQIERKTSAGIDVA